MSELLEDGKEYLESMLEAVTGEQVEITFETVEKHYEVEGQEETGKQDVTVYTIHPTPEVVEMLTRDEGSALSALLHVFSVYLQRCQIAGRVAFDTAKEP